MAFFNELIPSIEQQGGSTKQTVLLHKLRKAFISKTKRVVNSMLLFIRQHRTTTPYVVIWTASWCVVKEVERMTNDSTFYFLFRTSMLITSKWNGINYYWYDEKGVHEVVRIRGFFYLAKLVIGEWLVRQWEPLKNFTLQED